MRKIVFRSVLAALSSITYVNFSQAQEVATVRYRHVDSEDMQEYIRRETTFWKPIAEQAIKDGGMMSWSIWQKVGGFDTDDEHNILIYATFEKNSDLDSGPGMGDAIGKVFPNKDFSEITVRHLFTQKAFLLYRPIYDTLALGISKELSPVIRVNQSKTPSAAAFNEYVRLESEVWAPFISSLIGTGKTKVTGWHFGIVLNPMGSDTPFDAVTVDGFASLGDAVSAKAFDDDVDFPDFGPFGEVHKKVSRNLYRLIASAR